MSILKSEIAECVGLWLAEGDSKTIREITFTNNCLDLILFFKEIISTLYKGKNKPRLYIYSPAERQLFTKLSGFKKVNFYIDKRANRPYYIYRLADTKFLREWRLTVKKIISRKDCYPEILRGIFAGEGNVKYDIKTKSRNLRIATKNRNPLIENLLNFYNLSFYFDYKKRQYWIRTRSLSKLDKINIAQLHPEKEAKFRTMMDSVLENHYSPNELKNLLLKELEKFKTTKNLSILFKRSELRILEVLQELKKEGKIDCIKIKTQFYWVVKSKKEEFRINEKKKILSKLDYLNSYTQIGKALDFSRKAISKRIENYEKENLVKKYEGWWRLTKEGNKLILGIDESGSEL